MLKAVDERKTTVEFYEVNYDLAVPSLEWLDDVKPNDLVILIDYFGFPCDASSATRAKEQGAWILKDVCQALLLETNGASLKKHGNLLCYRLSNQKQKDALCFVK